MPRLAVFTAAAEIGNGEHATVLQKTEPSGRETGRQTNIEPAVTVKNCRVVAIALNSLLRCQKHRDRSAVLRGIFDLLDDVRIEIDVGVNSRPLLGCPSP